MTTIGIDPATGEPGTVYSATYRGASARYEAKVGDSPEIVAHELAKQFAEQLHGQCVARANGAKIEFLEAVSEVSEVISLREGCRFCCGQKEGTWFGQEKGPCPICGGTGLFDYRRE